MEKREHCDWVTYNLVSGIALVNISNCWKAIFSCTNELIIHSESGPFFAFLTWEYHEQCNDVVLKEVLMY